MHHPIQVGRLSITFLKSRHETGGAFDLFELIVPPNAFLNVPHLHRDYDETIFGLNGLTTWTVNGEQIPLNPGRQLHIPRGTIHSYTNPDDRPARMMCLLTPGLVGPEYFRELASAFTEGGPPNIIDIGNIMLRYGVIPISAER